MSHLRVGPVPAWVPVQRLLDDGPWEQTAPGWWEGERERSVAADLAARLRGVGLGGQPVTVHVSPRLPRKLVRAARLADARRRRDTTRGFTRSGTRLDDEGRWSLTPEALALALGKRARGMNVVDAGCGAGGNAIGFARAGCRVVAVERDTGRLALARHNARVYGVADRIRFVHGDARDVSAAGGLLFGDPPWGTDWSRDRVELADLPMAAELLTRRDEAAAVWLKVPPSTDPADATTAEAWFGEAPGDRQRVKFVLLTW